MQPFHQICFFMSSYALLFLLLFNGFIAHLFLELNIISLSEYTIVFPLGILKGFLVAFVFMELVYFHH